MAFNSVETKLGTGSYVYRSARGANVDAGPET